MSSWNPGGDIDLRGSVPAASTSKATKKKSKAAQDKADKEEVKRRSSKACDQCRKAKCKCTLHPDGEGNLVGPCDNCTTTSQECTFRTNSRKRGPPKGYIEAVESRLHRMEALLGGLLTNDDPRAQALLSELIGDEETREFFARDIKAAAAIGIDGKARRSWAQPGAAPADGDKSPSSMSPDDLYGDAIGPLGQQQAINNLADDITLSTAEHVFSHDDVDPLLLGGSLDSAPTRRKRRQTTGGETERPDMARTPTSLFAVQRQQQSFGPDGTSSGPFSSTINHTGFAGSGMSTTGEALTELSDVVGQLSLNEHSEIRYHGRSSGLYLISDSQRYQNFFWQFPKAGIWPSITPSEKPIPSQEEMLRSAGIHDILPDKATQTKLLDAYWAFVHPHFPVLFRPLFNIQLGKTQPGSLPAFGSSTDQVPAFLLLTVYALSARYLECDKERVQGVYWSAGDEFVDAAKRLLSQDDYGSSHLSTVQGLLLLAYREVGIGKMAQSWSLVGMAIRMAQDMGLFRDVDRWCMPVARFSHEEKQSRKRAWWGCVNLDKYISAYIGRPMAIFERDWDTQLPSEDEPDEHDQWRPVRLDGTDYNQLPQSLASSNSSRLASAGMPSTKTYAISTFNRSSELSVHMSRIISHLYAIRVRVLGQSSETLLSHLDQGLAKFYLDLPPHLRYSVNSKVPPPPHILVLHCQFFCALILLHRPFIPNKQDSVSSTALPSHSIATTAANAIANIATVYSKTYGLEQAVPFMVYYVFSAAIMCVYNTRWPGEAKTAQVSLAKCMKALKEMEVIWGSAARQRELLVGLVDLAEAEQEIAQEGQPGSKTRNKRNADTQNDDDMDNLPPQLDFSMAHSPPFDVSTEGREIRRMSSTSRQPNSNSRASESGSMPFDPIRHLSTSMPATTFNFSAPSSAVAIPGTSNHHQGPQHQQGEPQLSNSMFNDLLTSFLGNAAAAPMGGFSNSQFEGHIHAGQFGMTSPPPNSTNEPYPGMRSVGNSPPPWMMSNWIQSPPNEPNEPMNMLSAAALGDHDPSQVHSMQHTSDFIDQLKGLSPGSSALSLSPK